MKKVDKAYKPGWCNFRGKVMKEAERDAIIRAEAEEKARIRREVNTGSPEVDILVRWREDPLFWFQCMFPDYELRDWQKEAFVNFVKHKRSAIKSGHRVGKTMFEAILSIYGITVWFPIKVVFVTPSAGQLDDGAWSEIRTWMGRLPPAFRDKYIVNSDKVYMEEAPGECFITRRSGQADNPESLQGIHSENLWLVVDEASGVEDIVFEYMMGNISGEGGKLLLAGNPTRTVGQFYQAFHKLAEIYKTMTVSTLTVPGIDPNFPKSLELQHGRESNVYRVRILGEFPLGDDDTIIPRWWVEAAMSPDRGEETPLQPHEPVVWGVDPAGPGRDRAGLVKRQGLRVLERGKTLGTALTPSDVARWVAGEWESTPRGMRPEWIAVDSNGWGAGVASLLQDWGYPVYPVNYSRASSQKERFERLKDELWWRCREWFAQQNVYVPEDEVLIQELCVVEYVVNVMGKIKVEGKAEVRKRLGRSPDLADSLVMTFAPPIAASRGYSNKSLDELIYSPVL